MADLTTVAAVKAFLSITVSTQDALIASLIPRNSRQIENYTQREFPAVTRTEQKLNGTGSATLVLPDGPVLEVTYLEVDGVEIPASTSSTTYGYQYDDFAIYLIGAIFPRGRRNVTVSYSAGYEDSETAYIPSANTPTITPTTGGRAETNISVTDANGTVYSEVANGPVAGQYSFADGVYTFNASDANTSVTLAYRPIPAPVEQTAIEMVATDMKQRDSIGIRSKSIAGEVISYTAGSLTVDVKQKLDPYRKRTPA